MKKTLLTYTLLLVAGFVFSQGSNTWTQKADFGGTARFGAVGFSIDTKGYLGTGAYYDGTTYYYKDFWEYNPDANTWTQKADFGGTARRGAVGFSIGSKGYLGTGYYNGIYYKDFWEYDPDTNTWIQKADFGGNARLAAIGFSIGNKGYLGTGFASGSYANSKDFWEFDPNANTWTQKSDFGGIARNNAVGFSIGSKGYLGTGSDDRNYRKDFWEYDPNANTWTRKADFGGIGRTIAVGFSISSKGYLGTGFNYAGADHYLKDFWEYDPDINTWIQKADFGGTARYAAVGFSIGSKGYLGTGDDVNAAQKKDFWEYTPESSGCLEPANLSVTNITSSSAKLNWNSMSGAIGYKVRYKVAGSSAWTNIQSNDNDKDLNGLAANIEYAWQVKSICGVLPIVSSAWSEKQKFTTGSVRIGGESFQQLSFHIYPNPAQDQTTIHFTLTHSSHVCVKVYDVNGKEIKTLVNDELQEGEHSLLLNTDHFAKGVYVVRVIYEFGMENQKLMVQ